MDFDKMALEWDTEYRINRAKILTQSIVTEICCSDYKHVLDFGCGTGLLACQLANKFETILCVDTSEIMIETLNKKIKSMNLTNISTACIDLLLNEDLGQKFDLIYTSMALHHVTNIDKIINIFNSLLFAKGMLALIDLDEDDGSFHKNEINFDGHNGFNRNKLKSILEQHGFANISYKTIFIDKKNIDNKMIDYSLFLCLARKS